MSVTKSDLFEDISVSMDCWTDAVSDALTKSGADLLWAEDREPYQRLRLTLADGGMVGDDLKKVLAECLRGFAVSILTTIDGGTALSEKGRLYLVDGAGERFGDGLHDDFVSHLLATGRLQ